MTILLRLGRLVRKMDTLMNVMMFIHLMGIYFPFLGFSQEKAVNLKMMTIFRRLKMRFSP